MSPDLQNEIKELLAKGKIKEACELLIDTPLSEEAIKQMARLERLNKSVRTGQINNEDASIEYNRIVDALIALVNLKEVPPSVQKKQNRLVLFLILGGMLLLLPLGLWFFNAEKGQVDCTEVARPYTIVVADFMQEKPAFSRRVVTNLSENFLSNQDLLRISPLSRFIDPRNINEATFNEIINQNCVDKGIVLYGTLDELGDERLFNCFIKLEGLQGVSLHTEKASLDQVVFTNESNLKVPNEISFSISQQAQLVSDFTTGLLKYYLGDRAAVKYFLNTIQGTSPTSEEKLYSVANLYLGNVYLASGEAEKALVAYNRISQNPLLKSEVTWNKSIAHLQLGEFTMAAKGFAAYVEAQSLQPQDTLILLKMSQYIEEALPRAEAEAALAPIASIIPKDTEELEPETEPEVVSSPIAEIKDVEKDSLFGQKELIRKSVLVNISSKVQDSVSNQDVIDGRTKSVAAQRPTENTRGMEPKPALDRDQLPRPKMIYIEGGTFKMGDGDDFATTPRHQVNIKSFQLSATEVTNAQYAAFLNKARHSYAEQRKWIDLQQRYNLARGRITYEEGSYKVEPGYEDHPVIFVSWYGARAYCKEMGYRLPSEAEWEYAAGGGSTKRTKWAGTKQKGNLNEYAIFHTYRVYQVGARKSNRLGIFDMSGNVWEWCQDTWHNSYKNAPNDGSAWEGSSSRVIRGGSWIVGEALHLEVCRRYDSFPRTQSHSIGFRVAR